MSAPTAAPSPPPAALRESLPGGQWAVDAVRELLGAGSTRLLTRDDVEVTIPNAVMGNAKIVNESGGPWARERVRVPVQVAYGSDVDRVRAALLAVVAPRRVAGRGIGYAPRPCR